MDPPTLMNDNSFPSANGGPYNFSEIWPFPMNGGGESSAGGRLELRRPPFVADLSHFATEAAIPVNRDGSGNEGGGGEQSRRGGGSARKRRDSAEEAAAMSVSTSSANAANGSDGKRLKTSGSEDENQTCKGDGEGNSGKGVVDQGSKSQSEPPKDYIHVRARRGQATDSHSLAERARREKISERMKILQDLVPGCNKVIGKALVLDEIINYIQSLQRQVEFLSMKLEAVNSRMNIGMEGFPSKEFIQPAGFDPSTVPYASQAPREYARGSSPEWLHMQVGSGFERQT